MSDDESRLVELEYIVGRHEDAVIQDAKDIAGLNKNVQILAKEVERLNKAVLFLAQALATLPGWVEKGNVEAQIHPQIKYFERFKQFIDDFKKMVGP